MGLLDDLDFDIDSPFDEDEKESSKAKAKSQASARRISVDSILKGRHKREALQREAQERIKRLKQEGGEGEEEKEKQKEETEDDIERRFEEAMKREREWLEVSKMEEYAKQITSAIGSDEPEDEEPELFPNISEIITTTGERAHGRAEDAAAMKQKQKKKKPSSLQAEALDVFKPCVKACDLYGIKFEECKDLMVEELLSGCWLNDKLHTLGARDGTFYNAEMESWLTETMTSSCSQRRSNDWALNNAFPNHFATEALCSASCGEFDDIAPSQSEAFEDSFEVLERCLDISRGEEELSMLMMNSLRVLRTQLSERWKKENVSSLSDKNAAAKMIHMLILICSSRQVGLVYDVALSVAALVLSKIDAKNMKVVAKMILDSQSSVGGGGSVMASSKVSEKGKKGSGRGRGQVKKDRRDEVASIPNSTTSHSSIQYAHTRVLRDLFFEASSNSTPNASQNALHLIGRYTLQALRALTGNDLQSFSGEKSQSAGTCAALLSGVEHEILRQIQNDSQLIISRGLERKEGCGIWEFHDLLKMLDVYLFCLPTQASLLKENREMQKELMGFLTQVMKQFRKCQKESARHTRVLASELHTTYQLVFSQASSKRSSQAHPLVIV